MDKKEFLKKICNRDDVRWAHPEVKDYYTAGFGNDSSFLFDESIPYEERKKMNEEMLKAFPPGLPLVEGRMAKYLAPGCPEEEDAPGVPMYIAKPQKCKKKMPCVIIIPGGGLTSCNPLMKDLCAKSDLYGAIVVSLAYRTIFAEKGTYPAAINDCHAVYKYIVDNADELGIDANKIVVEGGSSGGHLVLALCHRLKKYGYRPRGCVAALPIPDDRTIYGTTNLEGEGWVGSGIRNSSKAWLNGLEGDDVPAEAFANHATIEDCIGLPPTFIHTMEIDPGTDASMNYMSKLLAAGVFCEMHIWGGSNHVGLPMAGEFDPSNVYGKRYLDIYNSNIRDCIKYDLRREWLDELK